MSHRRFILLCVLLCAGALLLVGFLLPDVERLVRADLPDETHVTVLARGDGDTLLAATQVGTIWRLKHGVWRQERTDLAGHLVLALGGDVDRMPIGTASGLLMEHAVGPIPGDPRVSDLLVWGDALLAATGAGLWVAVGDTWSQPLADRNLYRLIAQPGPDETILHAGTIGDGVYSAPARTLTQSWQPNSLALPHGVKILSFAVTAFGPVLAGTDQGLFWQSAPGTSWRVLDPQLHGRRILALFCEPIVMNDGQQRLWIGGDAGLVSVDLLMRDGRLLAAGVPRVYPPLWEPLRAGVSWIQPSPDGLVISAGALYRLQSVRPPGWFRFPLAAIILVVAVGGWWWLNPPSESGDSAR
ncbi:ABC transporter substrate-binding protein [Thiocapsa imhoffii]|uniref:ABC transporter substrate-binding protein n=1 Tax=Thiocapsa imhoffii TaxID=382777 RepID=UPI001902F633|nr:ABC transporter substrate-binding protein [Thiocapsa imhoffii]